MAFKKSYRVSLNDFQGKRVNLLYLLLKGAPFSPPYKPWKDRRHYEVYSVSEEFPSRWSGSRLDRRLPNLRGRLYSYFAPPV